MLRGAGLRSASAPAALPEDSPERRLADETRHEALARQYVKRYGVVFRDLLARETQAPPWRDLVRIYRRLEMSGELRGGRFVGGFVGEQFAMPDAVDALRAARREPKRGEIVRLSACDPLNLVGIITPGARVPAAQPNTVVYEDGVPQRWRRPPPPATAAAPGPPSRPAPDVTFQHNLSISFRRCRRPSRML